jgi:hypothetical protein
VKRDPRVSAWARAWVERDDEDAVDGVYEPPLPEHDVPYVEGEPGAYAEAVLADVRVKRRGKWMLGGFACLYLWACAADAGWAVGAWAFFVSAIACGARAYVVDRIFAPSPFEAPTQKV